MNVKHSPVHWAVIVSTIAVSSCERKQPDKTTPQADSLHLRLRELAEKHAAELSWGCEVGEYGKLQSLDIQDALDSWRGKPVAFLAFLGDVYRLDGRGKAVFFPFEMAGLEGFDLTVVLDTSMEEARLLAEHAHAYAYLDLEVAVVARFSGLTVSYEPLHDVVGEEGEALDRLDVVHSGLNAVRLIRGELIEFAAEE